MKAKIKQPPPWNWKTQTERGGAAMMAWVKETLEALQGQDARAQYEESVRSIHQLASWSPRDQRNAYRQLSTSRAKREWQYGNREPMRKLLPEAPEWINEPKHLRNRGQRPPQRERDRRNARLVQAIKDVHRIRDLLPTGRWPRPLVVRVIANHHGFSVEEVERALDRGTKEIEEALRHLSK